MKVQIDLPDFKDRTIALSLDLEPSDLVIKAKNQIYQLLNKNITSDDTQNKYSKLSRKLTRQGTSKSQQVMHYMDGSDEESLDYKDYPRFTAKASIVGSSPESLQLFYKLKILDNDKRLQDYDINELSVLHLQAEKTIKKVGVSECMQYLFMNNRSKSKIWQKRRSILKIHCQKEWNLSRR